MRNFKRIGAFLVLLLLLSGCSSAFYRKTLVVPQMAYAAGSMWDLKQTISCIDAGRCVEGNPLVPVQPNSVGGIAYKVGVTTGLLWLTQKISQQDDPKWAPAAAWWMQTTMAGFQTWVVYENSKTIRSTQDLRSTQEQ